MTSPPGTKCRPGDEPHQKNEKWSYSIHTPCSSRTVQRSGPAFFTLPKWNRVCGAPAFHSMAHPNSNPPAVDADILSTQVGEVRQLQKQTSTSTLWLWPSDLKKNRWQKPTLTFKPYTVKVKRPGRSLPATDTFHDHWRYPFTVRSWLFSMPGAAITVLEFNSKRLCVCVCLLLTRT